jgi:hypothetical protein
MPEPPAHRRSRPRRGNGARGLVSCSRAMRSILVLCALVEIVATKSAPAIEHGDATELISAHYSVAQH